jgi:hypothetical protein
MGKHLALLLILLCTLLGSPKLLAAVMIHHEPQLVILRMDASDDYLVYQVVGKEKENRHLYSLNLVTLEKKKVPAVHGKWGKKLRPFGPSVKGEWLSFGAGNLFQSVNLYLVNLNDLKKNRIAKKIPWIIEPNLALDETSQSPVLVWEETLDDNGKGMAMKLYDQQESEFSVLQKGAATRTDIPRSAQDFLTNEYPALMVSKDHFELAFQNNEFGVPNVYYKKIERVSGQASVKRLASTGLYQERPEMHGDWIVWEQSEQGFARSYVSDVYAWNKITGEKISLNRSKGFHYQAKVYGDYAFYGTKREPNPSVPSLRVYDLKNRVEIEAQNCFPGPIYDYSANKSGIIAAQRTSSGGSILWLASWSEIAGKCSGKN